MSRVIDPRAQHASRLAKGGDMGAPAVAAQNGMHGSMQSAYPPVHPPYEGPVRVAVELIDVAAAKALLLENTNNRRLKTKLVQQVSQDMRAGRFALNGETIKVAGTGRLLDGQNRLTAIVETDLPQWLVVVRGLPEPAQDTVDIGAKRSLGDVLTLHGESNGNSLAAATMLAWKLSTNGHIGSGANTPYPSQAELQRYLDENRGIRDSLDVGDGLRKSVLRYPPSPCAALHYLMAKKDVGRADEFWSLLRTGAGLDEGSPILTLRGYLIRDLANGNGSRINLPYRVAITIKAWNAFRAGRSLRVIKWVRGGDTQEDFPAIK